MEGDIFMPYQDHNDPAPQGSDDNDFLSYLELAVELMASNRFTTFGDTGEVDTYATYLSYRVQRDLFHVCQGAGILPDYTWDDFILELRRNKPARETARAVVREALNRIYTAGQYNFDEANIQFPIDDDVDPEDDMLHCAAIFTEEAGRTLVQEAVFRVELAHYKHLRQGRDGFTWEKYQDEMMQRGTLNQQSFNAVRRVLMDIDFKPLWKSESLEKLAKDWNAPEHLGN